ncbi:hypothetical protein RJ640_010154 [Escallonia rubra]|uniref:PUM-HD domain-containing protein n=1 Tax=Escallonia rubra TaxID=112253 RepID=A0AA88U0J0_9ASTE|nr:hypothetical protein RJ640_010154 [Escallonia rubra]
MSANPFYGYPSASFSANEFLGNARVFDDPAASVYDLGMADLNDGAGPYSIYQDMYVSHELNAATSGNNGPCSGTGYSLSNSVASPSSYDDQSSKQLLNKLDIDMLATDQYGSQILRSLSESHGTMRNEITERVPNYPQLMEDQHGSHLFQRHLEGSTKNELELIVNQIASLNPDKLLKLATDNQGSNSFQRLNRCLKKSHRVASMLISSLSTKFSELVIHRTGRHVIKQCLNLLGDEPNKGELVSRFIMYGSTVIFLNELLIRQLSGRITEIVR